MKQFFLLLFPVSVFMNCNHLQTHADNNSEIIQLSEKLGCAFINPDTSLCGIILGNAKSTLAVIGNNNTADSLGQYHFYSIRNRETLTLMLSPGDGQYEIGIIRVESSGKYKFPYPQLNIDTFKTEKGIKLGMTKQQIIALLGNCYTAVDSSKCRIELNYRKVSQNGSTQFPIYFGSYKLWKDKLICFEFGFEYPKRKKVYDDVTYICD